MKTTKTIYSINKENFSILVIERPLDWITGDKIEFENLFKAQYELEMHRLQLIQKIMSREIEIIDSSSIGVD
jgi:hypothetical protein